MNEMEININIDPKYLGKFWDWMHYHWYLSSQDGCASSNDDSFYEYVKKFIKEYEEKHPHPSQDPK